VGAALLLAIRVGVVAAQAPAGSELPVRGQLQALGNGLVQVDFWGAVTGRRIIRSRVLGTEGMRYRITAGDLVIELVVEQGGVGIEPFKVVEVDAEFRTGTDLGLQIGIANGD